MLNVAIFIAAKMWFSGEQIAVDFSRAYQLNYRAIRCATGSS